MGDPVKLVCPTSGPLCYPVVVVPMAPKLCVFPRLHNAHCNIPESALREHITHPGAHPKNENANNSVASFQNK